MTKGFSAAPWIAAALYLGFRAFALHTNFDAVAMPVFEVPVMGNLAALASTEESGAPLELYYDNCGGHILIGLLAAPLYALFGDSYLTLKLVPVGLGLATLLLFWRILARHYDRRAADLFAFLFVLGPPTLAKYSMLAKGNHFENLFFQTLALALFLRMHARGTTARALVATGAAAGFALFVYFGSIVVIAILAVMHVAVRRRRAFGDVPAGVAGLALGLAPLAWIQIAAEGRPATYLRAKLASAPAGGPGGVLERLRELFTEVLPRAGVFEDVGELSGRIGEGLFLAAFALAWLTLAAGLAARLLRRRTAPRLDSAREGERARFDAWKMLPFVAYLPLFALFVSAARFDFDVYGRPVEVGRYRYLVPHFLLALASIALASAHLARAKGAARLAGRGLAVAALATGLFTLPIIDWRGAQTGYGARYPGHFFLQYANVVLRADRHTAETGEISWDSGRVEAALAGLAPAHRFDAWTGVGYYVAWAQHRGSGSALGGSQGTLALAKVVSPYAREVQPALARGAGSYLRRLAVEGGDPTELARELDALVAEAHPLLSYLVEGLCLDLRYPLVRLGLPFVAASAELEPVIPAALRASWRRGQGVQVGRIAARGLPADLGLGRRLAATILEDAAPEFWFGMGFGMAQGAEGEDLPPSFDLLVPAEMRQRALEGYGASLRAMSDAETALAIGAAHEAELEEADRAAFGRGLRWAEYPAPYRW